MLFYALWALLHVQLPAILGVLVAILGVLVAILGALAAILDVHHLTARAAHGCVPCNHSLALLVP